MLAVEAVGDAVFVLEMRKRPVRVVLHGRCENYEFVVLR